MRLLHLLRESIASVLFVRTCAVCGTRVEGEKDGGRDRYICTHCMAQLPRTQHFVNRGNRLESLFYRHDSFVRAAAFLYYDKNGVVQSLVHKFKYYSQPQIAYQLACNAALEARQTDFFDDIDCIIPVPLHPRRQRQRGYNQSEYIAQALTDVTKVPMKTGFLLRKRNNPQQALKSGIERKENVRDLFKVVHPEELFRRHILLVDDVVTTGSTISACMEALQPCWGSRVSIFSLTLPG